MSNSTGPWIVRLGKVRGEGKYIPHTAVCLDFPPYLRMTGLQRDARRFNRRLVADMFAHAFGGRVVRLKERAK